MHYLSFKRVLTLILPRYWRHIFLSWFIILITCYKLKWLSCAKTDHWPCYTVDCWNELTLYTMQSGNFRPPKALIVYISSLLYKNCIKFYSNVFTENSMLRILSYFRIDLSEIIRKSVRQMGNLCFLRKCSCLVSPPMHSKNVWRTDLSYINELKR